MKTLVLAGLAGAVAAAAAAPTFNHDIAPILYKNCATCHRPGEVAPFSLLTYQDAAKRAKPDRDGDAQPLHAAVEGRAGLRFVPE